MTDDEAWLRLTAAISENRVAVTRATATMFTALPAALMRDKVLSHETIDARALQPIEAYFDIPPDADLPALARMEAEAVMEIAFAIRSQLPPE